MISELINKSMLENKLNQVEFAAWLSEKLSSPIAHNTISYWRSGRFNPKLQTLIEAIRVYPAEDPRGRLAREMAIAIGFPELAGDARREPA